jgi:ABC-type phosphate transport system substrate-binding protein
MAWSMRMRSLPLALCGALLTTIAAHAQAPAYKVIAHPAVAGNAIPKATLTDIFFGRLVRWADGRPIVPVDQSMTSPVRAEFSQKALGQSVMAVNHHWMRQIQAGKRPPIVKKSDAEVIAYVAANEGSIAYIAADATLPATVKALEVK